MARYDYGTGRRGGYWSGDWSNPNGGGGGAPYHRQGNGERPWVGGYREGYQGGGGGYSPGRYAPRRGRSQARDEWWLGGHHPGRYDETYDARYREFDERNRPRYSPVGGTYHAMGGQYQYGRTPRPLREDMWFSDWTRWF